ncbi:hypothetical protein [Spartinivicinus poritis]|uniref:Uncharacterized protein n=1 Tax=Spartinivicinus poritis TaxID=2994640 RepID=A0ABT5UF88_9GAMM|nr:hypothetical protein [Spartinivicinus sp. A2-2]MDE1463754.1 hypothetical protein [Spartinivicinus sp. A2-2]
MLKFIIVLVVIIAIGVGGAQFYITYKVDKFLEQMSSYAAMTGFDFSYKDIKTTYVGALEVSEVEFGIPIPEDNVTFNTSIDLMRVKFPSLLDVIQLFYKDMEELPSSLKFEINGVRISPENIVKLNPFIRKPTYYPFYLAESELGLDETILDASVGYTYYEYTSGADIDLNYEVRGIKSYSMNVKVKEIPSINIKQLFMMYQTPQLQLMNINYTDQSYNELWIKLCKEKHKITADQCIDREIKIANKHLKRIYSLSFSEQYITKVKEFIKATGGNIKVSVDLSDGSKSFFDAIIKWDDPINAIIQESAMLSINGEYIQPIFSRLSEEEIAKSVDVIEESDEPIKKKERKKIVLKVYDDFRQYVGKKVLIITDKRKQYIGTVLDAKQEGIKIKVRLEKGDTFTYRLAYDRIKYAEVYQTEPLYR